MGPGVVVRGVVTALAEVFAPDRCFLCGQGHDPVLERGFPPERFARCLIDPVPSRLLGVPVPGHPVCPVCAGGLRETHVAVTLPPAYRLVSPFLDSPELVKLVHLIKFHGLRGLADLLGAAMACALVRQAPARDAVLVPVPMDRRSRRRRGFNQAELLADAVGRRVALPVARAGLVKLRRVRAQSLTDADDRDANVRGAFGNGRESVRGRHVVLVDDLVTTGATARACARALEKAGAGSVRVLAAGRAGAARSTGPEGRNRLS